MKFLGALCILAAITGAGVTAAGIIVPGVPNNLKIQLLLGIFGLGLIVLDVMSGGRWRTFWSLSIVVLFLFIAICGHGKWIYTADGNCYDHDASPGWIRGHLPPPEYCTGENRSAICMDSNDPDHPEACTIKDIPAKECTDARPYGRRYQCSLAGLSFSLNPSP